MDYRIETERLDAGRSQDIERAAEILRRGGTVAFPTETVYGLGANALDPAAVEKIFLAKQRPHWDPLIVHISNLAMLNRVAVFHPGTEPVIPSGGTGGHKPFPQSKDPEDPSPGPAARTTQTRPPGLELQTLIDRFWPGPLTLLLPRATLIPAAVTAGRPLVGVRTPFHPVALELIRQAGLPIAAPSANRFGHTSPTSAAHVLADLDGRIDAVLDGGPTQVGVESTVLDPTQWPMILYRQGAVTQTMLEDLLGQEAVSIFAPASPTEDPQSLPSPGVGLRHYAPNARLLLIDQPESTPKELDRWAESDRFADPLRSADGTLGVMLPTGWPLPDHAIAFPWGDWKDKQDLARRLFAGLRDLDDRGATLIVCPLPSPEGLGAAIRDRLQKAAKP